MIWMLYGLFLIDLFHDWVYTLFQLLDLFLITLVVLQDVDLPLSCGVPAPPSCLLRQHDLFDILRMCVR
jgi:hypothetical protein